MASLFAGVFGLGQISAMRHAVATIAAESGLSGQRLADFVLAVNELMSNAVRHAGGRGWIEVSRVDGRLCCEVADRGPGISSLGQHTQDVPPGLAVSGRGLWLVHRLCEDVSVATGPQGTTIRVAASLHADG